jgi:hypothetical protein
MQNFLIGENLNGCAFVVGSLSFLDKMSCGIALYILQSYQSKFLKFHLFDANVELLRVFMHIIAVVINFKQTCFYLHWHD